MRVQAQVSFVAAWRGQQYVANAGELIEMPDDADWLRAGLVAAVPAPAEVETATAEVETATAAPEDAERAVSPRRRRVSA